MSPKKSYIWICAAILLVATLVVFRSATQRNDLKITNEKGHNKLFPGSESPNRRKEPPEVHAVRNPAENSPPLITLIPGGVPYETTILVLAANRPALNISEADAEALQQLYTQYCHKRVELETRIANITRDSNGVVTIMIPVYAAEAKTLQAQLVKDINGYYDGAAPGDISAAIADAYVGDSNALGAYEQMLTIQAKNDPQYKYEVIREVFFTDPLTGKITGSSRTVSQVTRISESSYTGQETFFPKP